MTTANVAAPVVSSTPKNARRTSPRPDFDARSAPALNQDEIRANLLRAIERNEPLFPASTLRRHRRPAKSSTRFSRDTIFILLDSAARQKSRILRGLINLLDPEIPVIAGCEINDDRFIQSAVLQSRLASDGDNTPSLDARDLRYVEKLARPTSPSPTSSATLTQFAPHAVAATSPTNSPFITAFLPRANRGIFAINELPDLAGKIQ